MTDEEYNTLLHTGYYRHIPFVVRAMRGLGHRCGYVVVPPPLDKLWTDVTIGPSTEVAADTCDVYEHYIQCHGGVTYSSDVIAWYGKWSGHVVGFDCAHAGDARDPSIMDDEAKRYQLELEHAVGGSFGWGDKIRDTDYCIKQCQLIIDQLWQCGSDDPVAGDLREAQFLIEGKIQKANALDKENEPRTSK